MASIALIYNVVDDWEREDINSVLEGVTSIRGTLEDLGHRVESMAINHGIARFVQQIEATKPDVIFNLCEGFLESSAGEYCVAGLLELLGIPYTGSGPLALALALDKPLSKRLFVAEGIPTPDFAVYAPGDDRPPLKSYPAILKLACEDASVGITRENVVTTEAAFSRRLGEPVAEYNAPVLAEQFIDGREFTVAILDGEPIALEEIEFDVEPRILSYGAKWTVGSTEYVATTPQFAPKVSEAQRTVILELARRVYRLIGIRDYGRVDFRMDDEGRPFVLEANPNPDITPNSGYRLALDAAGIHYPDFVTRLINNAMRRGQEKGV